MVRVIFKWIILSLSVYAAGYFVAGVFVADFWVAALAGAILLFINTLVKPVIKILTLPLMVVTFGLFSLVLNGLFFMFVSQIISGLSVSGFAPAIWGSVIVSVLTWLAEKITD
jgi:putative membrane protein